MNIIYFKVNDSMHFVRGANIAHVFQSLFPVPWRLSVYSRFVSLIVPLGSFVPLFHKYPFCYKRLSAVYFHKYFPFCFNRLSADKNKFVYSCGKSYNEYNRFTSTIFIHLSFEKNNLKALLLFPNSIFFEYLYRSWSIDFRSYK